MRHAEPDIPEPSWTISKGCSQRLPRKRYFKCYSCFLNGSFVPATSTGCNARFWISSAGFWVENLLLLGNVVTGIWFILILGQLFSRFNSSDSCHIAVLRVEVLAFEDTLFIGAVSTVDSVDFAEGRGAMEFIALQIWNRLRDWFPWVTFLSFSIRRYFLHGPDSIYTLDLYLNTGMGRKVPPQ